MTLKEMPPRYVFAMENLVSFTVAVYINNQTMDCFGKYPPWFGLFVDNIDSRPLPHNGQFGSIIAHFSCETLKNFISTFRMLVRFLALMLSALSTSLLQLLLPMVLKRLMTARSSPFTILVVALSIFPFWKSLVVFSR